MSLHWWPVAATALALQIYLTWGAGLQLEAAWRIGTLWGTHAVIAVVLLRNLRFPGMHWLLAGMALNFLVMAANGGLMPVSPETLIRGGREQVLARNTIGEPLTKKNVILPEEETRRALLSDRLVVPGQRGAFSVGDVLIAVGIVVALGAAGGSGTAPARVEPPRERARGWGTPVVA